MLTGDGSYAQCYNGQAVVDVVHQIIVAAKVNDCADDAGNLIPMTEQTASNLGGELGTEFFIHRTPAQRGTSPHRTPRTHLGRCYGPSNAWPTN